MPGVVVRFVGSGDAFGSGGRFQACISLQWEHHHVLLDCGASSLISMRRLGIDPQSVQAILVSHLHGDHFGGIPFLVLDQQFSRREEPLLVAGPLGTQDRVTRAMEVLFPGSSTVPRRFELQFAELAAGIEVPVGPAHVTAYAVDHASGAPALALRVACGGRVIAYSGDTAMSDSLLHAAEGADLFICEAYTFDTPIKYHLSYTELRRFRSALGCRRLVLTHCGPQALARRAEIQDEVAEDGLALQL